MSNYLEFNGKYYALDLEKVIEFITNSTEVEDIHGKNIVQSYGYVIDENGTVNYDDGIKLINKEVSESKNSVNETANANRYGIIYSILNLILLPITDNNGGVLLTNSLSEMCFGQKIAFNTLVEMGIIYEIDE